MGIKTGISWCDHTHNIWWGCTKVGNSAACDNCYAETWAKRTGFQIWGDDKPRRYFSEKHLNEPLKWNHEAEAAGVRRRMFVMSMGDWAEGRPEQQPHLERFWNLICKQTPMLDKLMLTKRPQLISKLCPISGPDIWHGVTAETQQWLDLRWEHLRRVDSEVYWLSMEPLMERVVLPTDFLALGPRAWVIVGGESGGPARPMHPDWARSIRDQCADAGVPFHFKQWGEWGPGILDRGDAFGLRRVGKKSAGRELDGVIHDGFPEPLGQR